MKARKVKGLDPAGSLGRNAAAIVAVRLDELLGFVPSALRPGATEAQHDMRIAAKRLRYLLEFTEDCLGEAGPIARRAARDLQGVLGDIHDCDVMEPLARGNRGLDLLAVDLRARRSRLFAELINLWADQNSAGVWEGLAAAAAAGPGDAGATLEDEGLRE